MREKKNILVFPCGSEIGLEIHRSLIHSTYFHLIGASSVDDHGKFVFEDYVGDVPYLTDERFVAHMRELVKSRKIDAIYPATDAAITYLKRAEEEFGCMVISPCLETVELCLSKRKTYGKLQDVIPVPHQYASVQEIKDYPVFGKHDVGHSAIGTQRLDDESMAVDYLLHNPTAVICDYLPGDEYTVDCFSNSKGELLFYGVRERARIKNGISVNTKPVREDNEEFGKLIRTINANVAFRGAWFAQFKRNTKGELVLLEIAARLGGSSALFRAQGVNFAQLTLFDAFGYDVSVIRNSYAVEMDRALDNVFKMDVHYSEVYVDFDDCLSIEGKYVNTTLVAFLYQCINENVRLSLLTHHDYDINESLAKLRLTNVFDRIIHIDRTKKKADYVDNRDSIFIDDSYAERAEMAQIGVPVFSVDMIPMLLK